MLHAILHGKLGESVPEPQRFEDALTSTVFGTLVLAEAWGLLAHWLGVPFMYSTNDDEGSLRECWFWPRMSLAEPDVVLRLGGTLVVVEAKYRSGRHDLLPEDDDGEKDSCDQLVRQFHSVKEPLSGRVCYLEEIERAIRECQLVQVFVVDARSLRRARREWAESKERLHAQQASLLLVTWQSLYGKLKELELPSRRWCTDLRAYLRISGLDTFDGVPRGFASSESLQAIKGWRLESDRDSLNIRRAITLEFSQAKALQGWGLPGPPKGQNSFQFLTHEIVEGSFPTAIKAWCASKAGVSTQKRGFLQ